MFSTDTEEEAKTLIVMTCTMGPDGNYYARELIEEQNLDNLQAFSDKLALAWEHLKQRRAEADPSATNRRKPRK